MEVASVNVCVSEYLFKEFPINYDNFIWLVLCCDGGKGSSVLSHKHIPFLTWKIDSLWHMG